MAVQTLGAFAPARVARDLSLIAALCAAMIVPLPEAVEASPILGAFADGFHGLVFAAVGLFLLSRSKINSLRDCVPPMLIAAGLAITTELVQSLGPRDPSWVDLKTDLLGIIAATATATLFRKQLRSLSQSRRAVLVSVALVAIALILAPVLEEMLRWSDREQNFPVLFSADFKDVLKMTESLGELDEVEIVKHHGAIEVRLHSGPTPGIVITDFVADWRNRKTLIFDVENPSRDMLALEFHIRDRESNSEGSDRFSIRSTLAPSDRQSLRVPLSDVANGPIGRHMRMDSIKLIAAYRITPGADRFAIHSIRLE